MIVTFSVSNFRSFFNRETLSLVPSEKRPLDDGHVVSFGADSLSVLRTSVVYGANGAGKSNLFQALKSLRDLATGRIMATDRYRLRSFAFARETEQKDETTFDIQFVSGKVLYRYFLAISSERAVIEEEELSKFTAGDYQTVFVRERNDRSSTANVSFGRGFLGKPSKRLDALAVVGAPAEKTFLSSIASNMDMEVEEIGTDIANTLKWFGELLLISPDDSIRSLLDAYRDERVRLFASRLLEAASGVSQMVIDKTTLDEHSLRELIRPDIADKAIHELSETKHPASIVMRDHHGSEIQIDRLEGGSFGKFELKAQHALEDGRIGDLEISQESDGTKRLIELIPALYDLVYKNRVGMIDEVERSMHPLLCRAFLRSFVEYGGSGQLILSTHADGLLDDKLLRRDEVWFVEKDISAQSHLYSLNEFKERHKATLRQYYFQGRYGAIPFGFDSPSELLSESTEDNKHA